MIIEKLFQNKNYKNNIKKYKMSHINKFEYSLIKVLAVGIFMDSNVEMSELSSVKNILNKLYKTEKSNVILSGVIEKIRFYQNNPNDFKKDKKIVYNLSLKYKVFFEYIKKIFKSDVDFSPEEKIFYLSLKNSHEIQYEKLNPKLMRELEIKYENMKPKPKPKREYVYNPQPTFN